jgi:hypothetical protein
VNLASRADDLYMSLGEFKATDYPSGQVGRLFNAILGAAKTEINDPLVGAIEPADFSMTGSPTMDAGSMRAVLQQIKSALGGD